MFQYKLERLDIYNPTRMENQLNLLGKEGYELIQIIGDLAILKKPISKPRGRPKKIKE